MSMSSRIAAALIALLATATAHAGIRYEAVTAAAGKDGRNAQRYAVEAWVEGDSARVEFTETAGGIMPDEGYLVTTDGAETLYLVNPAEQTYMRWSLDAMLQSFGSVMDAMGGVVELEFSDPDVEPARVEPGEPILGYPTTHVHYSVGYTITMKIMGMTRQLRVDTVHDVWATNELTAAGFGAWLRTEPPRTGNEQLDALIDSQITDVHGLPLRTASVSTTTDGKGRTQVTRTTMEVTALEETDVEPGMFQIPAGYRQVEMPDLGSMGAGGKAGEQDEAPQGLKGILDSLGTKN